MCVQGNLTWVHWKEWNLLKTIFLQHMHSAPITGSLERTNNHINIDIEIAIKMMSFSCYVVENTTNNNICKLDISFLQLTWNQYFELGPLFPIFNRKRYLNPFPQQSENAAQNCFT